VEPFHLIIGVLIFFLVVGVCYFIIARLIMPAIPAPFQVWAWAIIGIILLICVLSMVAYGGPMLGIGGTGHLIPRS
jgi:hypothetical protein